MVLFKLLLLSGCDGLFDPFYTSIIQGDTIQLKCFYQSTGYNNVTLVSNMVVVKITSKYQWPSCMLLSYMQGGESTQEEMCYAFLLYYPKVDLSFCYSQPPSNSYSEFTEQHIQ